MLPRCAYVTAASPGIAEAYRDLCHIALPRCILNVFPLGDRPARFRPGNQDDPVRLHWFSQTIGPDRGLEDAVRALGLLKDYRIELHLRGTWHPGYEDELRRLACASGADPRRIVSHPPAPPDELVRLASEYDVGLALEPAVTVNSDILLSNKLFSYLLAGNAVVATRTRGQAGLAPELGCAVAMCDPGKPTSIAAALKPWLVDRGRLENARMAAWTLGSTRFNWDYEKRIFLDVIAAVAG